MKDIAIRKEIISKLSKFYHKLTEKAIFDKCDHNILRTFLQVVTFLLLSSR